MALVRGAYGGAQIKGSISSNTFQGSPYGTLLRTRSVPVNPKTVEQQLVRNILSQLSNAWTNTLTQVQRDGWKAYSDETPLPDKFGELRIKGGRQMYMRTNVGWVKAGGTRIDDAPGTPGVATGIVLALDANTTDGLRILGVTPAIPTGSKVFVRYGNPVSQAKNYYQAPFVEGTIIDDTTVFPATILAGSFITIGSKRFVASRHYEPSGKVSEQFIGSASAAV